MQAVKPEILSLTAFISAFVGFLFGLLSAVIIEAVKRRKEKQGLISLFLEENARVQRVPVGRRVQAANIMTRVSPEYPSLARQANIEGTVLFSALIGTNGLVRDLHIISGHPLLVPTAIDAVKKWVYRPTILNGNAVEVTTEVDVDFTLSTQRK